MIEKGDSPAEIQGFNKQESHSAVSFLYPAL